MSGIGSLGLLDSTLHYFMHGTKCQCCHRVLMPPSSYIDCPVLHQEASLQKTCAPEKKLATNELIISPCISNYERATAVPLLLYKLINSPCIPNYERATAVPLALLMYELIISPCAPTTGALLLYSTTTTTTTAVWPVSIANKAAIRARTAAVPLLLLLLLYVYIPA